MKEEKVKIYKRILALAIDIIVVAFISVLISYALPKNDEYITLQETQQELLNNRIQNKIDNEEYTKLTAELTYETYKVGDLETGVSVGIMILYFTLFTYFNKGQTPGKMLLKIKVSDKNGDNPNLMSSFIRSFFISRAFADIIILILVNSMKKAAFIKAYNYIDMILIILWLACPFIAMFREDGKGLHDLIAGTIVVGKRKRGDEIVEAKIEEKKEIKEKKTTKKTSKKK